MRILVLLSFLIITINSNSQIIQSSCTAPDSIISRYKEDAMVLTLRRIFLHGDTHKDSIQIPQSYVDTVLNAMIAVYNAITIPERDTVIDILNLSPLYDVGLHMFSLGADSSLVWMNELEQGNINTGFMPLDNILLDNNFIQNNYYTWPWWYHTSTFITTDTINIKAAISPLQNEPEVYYASPDYNLFDGPNIKHIVHPNYVEMRYHYRWGDCPSGCMSQRTWVFHIYYDCSVEFIGSYNGSEPIASLENFNIDPLVVAPNPFTHEISISGVTGNFNYNILGLTGKVVASGVVENSNAIDLSLLSSGSYLLLVEKQQMVFKKKLIKL